MQSQARMNQYSFLYGKHAKEEKNEKNSGIILVQSLFLWDNQYR